MVSHDGGIRLEEYRIILQQHIVDYIAITDHNAIDFAVSAATELGSNIIIGEEISSTDGDIIGLYLQSKIPRGKSALETAALIHEQGGLVYVPHPFERIRKGLGGKILAEILSEVDIVEVFNGRAVFSSNNTEAQRFATLHNMISASSSDAHCWKEVGRAYSIVSENPSPQTLKRLLVEAQRHTLYSDSIHLLCPKRNVIRKRFAHV
jgi:predicted metal-dependent phosphoesterase TrpH